MIYLLGALAVVLIGLLTSAFLFKDRIINEFIREANKSLNTPVKIGKVEVSVLSDFPNLAIVFHEVYVEDSHPGNFPLLKAGTVSFYINPIDAWRGQYNIRGLSIADSETNLKINKAGVTNYVILKPQEESTASTSIKLNLKNVNIINARVDYHDQQIQQHHQFKTDQLLTTLIIDKEVYHITTRGDVTVAQIGIRHRKFLENKTFEVRSTVHYDDQNKKVLIDPSQLQLGPSSFEIKGEYFFEDLSFINISGSGQQTTIQTILSLLPTSVSEAFKAYESEGELYFQLALKGEWSDQKVPLLSVSFGCSNATLLYPPTKTRLEHLTLEGSYASSSIKKFDQGELFLKNISGELDGERFEANLSIQDFNDPFVDFDFKGKLDAAAIQKFYPLPGVQSLSGNLDAAFSLAGEINLLKNKTTAQRVKTSGSIGLQDIEFLYGPRKVNFRGLNGTLQFTNNDLALSNVSGRVGKSDFLLNGFFKNVITFLLFDDQPIGIETHLKSNFIDLEELLVFGFGEQQSENYQFSISSNVNLNFNCDIQRLNYRRFKPSHIRGDLLVKNQMAVSRNTSLRALGGSITLNGILDAHQSKAIDLVTSFQLNGVEADSLFYVFENFRQDFIEDKHLKGQVKADVSAEMTLNEKLMIIPETLVADISATIQKGELNNFEPLQALNKYLDDEGLSRLRFADLKNDIHIEGKTVYIPQMEIKSNVTSIQISGKHTFDQQIDYRVIAPLINKKKIDADEAFGAIEDTGGGKTKLYLKITGTTENYAVSYDTEAVKKKIAGDLKKEVQELKDAFKTKGKKKQKELELEKDSYFDWNHP